MRCYKVSKKTSSMKTFVKKVMTAVKSAIQWYISKFEHQMEMAEQIPNPMRWD